jgi:predicted small secreted protein
MNEEGRMKKEKFVADLIASWSAAHVAGSQILKFTGGAINGRTVANRECVDKNPVPGRMIVGRQRTYPKDSLAQWIADVFFKG